MEVDPIYFSSLRTHDDVDRRRFTWKTFFHITWRCDWWGFRRARKCVIFQPFSSTLWITQMILQRHHNSICYRISTSLTRFRFSLLTCIIFFSLLQYLNNIVSLHPISPPRCVATFVEHLLMTLHYESRTTADKNAFIFHFYYFFFFACIEILIFLYFKRAIL